LEAAFYVALTTGLREGEIAALKWSDFDAGAGTLTVSKNAIRIGVYDPDTNEKTGTKVVIQDTPKSRAGHRVFPLLPKTVNAIQRHRIRQLDEKMKNRQLYVDNDLIFANEIGGLYDPKTFYTALRKICKRTPGLEPIKFHALRHTFATRGLEADISGKAMQGLLGHETEAMTLHYQQILEAQARKEIDKLQNAF
ncbi:MAG: site-specific integrase, partial [Clostridiales Family XIII bacterium]|nr:site-specific integrase [Clostridiales Family XIII bacterium]